MKVIGNNISKINPTFNDFPFNFIMDWAYTQLQKVCSKQPYTDTSLLENNVNRGQSSGLQQLANVNDSVDSTVNRRGEL